MSHHENREEILFEQCLELPPEEREAFVQEHCSDDPDLHDSLLSLLKAYESAGGFMENSHDSDTAEVAVELQRQAPSNQSPGDHIGRYQLLELIGEGAWGEVWLARQTEDIERKVAFKILKLGMDTKDFLARFEAERQMLALMDHPNVAHVLDTGATRNGRPYFVMELVKGEPLLDYVRHNRLTIEQRIQLFIQICHGIHHAHQKGIIHRDLKPNNILVTELDDKPVIKIIDFGVAKTTQFHLTDKTLVTGFHTFVGTPVYSSPEQLDLSGMEIDNRSDIYGLGVLLYELLCGRPPFDPDVLAEQSLESMREIIREQDPPKPSVRFQKLSLDQRVRIAGTLSIPPTKVAPRLQGDFDWIVMKCLEKNRLRRYESAHALVLDLQASLEHKPVEASPPSTLYLTGKFVKRHRVAVGLISAVTVALMLGLVFSLIGFRRASLDRDRAQEAERIAALDRDRALQAKAEAEAATIQAEHAQSRAKSLLDVHKQEVQPILDAAGQRDANIKLAEAAIEHYDQLPPELYDIVAIREHAVAYNDLIRAHSWHFVSGMRPERSMMAVMNKVCKVSAPLWRRVAEANPNDGEAWAEALWAEKTVYRNENKDTWDDVGWEAFRTDLLKSFLELEKRFPEEKTVLNYLVRCYRVRGGIEAMDESVERGKWLMEKHPHDDWVRSEHLASLYMAGFQYSSLGKGIEKWMSAFAGVNALLNENPSHWGYLLGARQIGDKLLSVETNERNRADLVPITLKHVERLSAIDPSEPLWHWALGVFSYRVAEVAWLDRRFDEVYPFLEQALKSMANVDPQYNNPRIEFARIWCHILAGMSAARMSETESTADHLGELNLAFQTWPQDNTDPALNIMRLCHLLFGQMVIHEQSEDWVEVENLAQAMLGKIEKHYEENPEETDRSDLPGFRTIAQAFLGKALLKQSKMDEALDSLRRARENFESLEQRWERDQDPNTINWVWKLNYWRPWEVAQNLAVVLLERGNQAESLELLELAFTQNDQWTRDNEGLLESRLRTARVGWKLVEALDETDPIQAVRRLEVLQRAAELLDDPDNEARFTSEEWGIKESIERTLYKRDQIKAPTTLTQTLAVIPFEILSPDPDHTFLAESVHLDIVTSLSKVDNLSVLGRDFTHSYRQTDLPLKQIGEELGFDFLLKGSVQRAVERWQFEVKLLEVASEKEIWAEKFDRSLDKVFNTYNEITKIVAEKLNIVLSARELARIDHVPTANIEAHNLYSQVRLLIDRTGRLGDQKIALLEKAVSLDPEFAEAWAVLANEAIYWWDVSGKRKNDALYHTAQSALSKASQFGPDLPETHIARSTFSYRKDQDLQGSVKYLLSALVEDSHNAHAHFMLGRRYLAMGRLLEAEHFLKLAHRNDPLSQSISKWLCSVYQVQGFWDPARSLIRVNIDRATDMKTKAMWQMRLAFTSYMETGDKQQLLHTIEAIPGFENDSTKQLVHALIKKDLSQAARLVDGVKMGVPIGSQFGPTSFRIDPPELLAAMIAFRESDMSEAIAYAAKVTDRLDGDGPVTPATNPQTYAKLALCYALRNDSASMASYASKAREASNQTFWRFNEQLKCELLIAMAQLVLGDDDAALATLEVASRVDGPFVLGHELDLWFIFDSLRGNPRFDNLVRNHHRGPGQIFGPSSITAHTPPPNSIAILPFQNYSPSGEYRHFADGFHDDLLSNVSRIHELITRSKTSVMAYRDTTKNVKEIGRELNVTAILEGSVQLIGKQIQITAQLVDARTDSHIWTETYRREMTAENYFETQNEISLTIANALNVKLSPEEQRRVQLMPTRNSAALEAYQLGKARRLEGDVAGLEAAIRFFNRAIKLDPDFAEAHALLGRTLLEVTWPASLSREEQMAKAEPHIYRSLELNESLSDAHLSLGLLKAWQGDLAGEEEAYRRALELNPHQTDALVMIASVVGDQEEKVRLLQKAYELDPEHPSAPFRLAWALRASGKLEACRQHLEDYAARNPENPEVYMELADLYMRHLGRYDEAIIAARKNMVLDPEAVSNRAYIQSCFVELGDLKTANRMFENRRKYQKEGQQNRRGILAYLFRKGDPVAREQTALDFLKIDPRQAIIYAHLAEIYLPAGRAEEALPYFKAGYPEFFEPTFELRGRQFCVDGQVVSSDTAGHPDLKPTGCGHTFDLQLLLCSFAAVFMETGYEEQARHLIQVALESIKPPKSLHMRKVEIDLVALSGDEAQAIELLKDHFDRGFSPYPITYHSLAREFLEKPECQKMIAEAGARMAVQLQRIREMEAQGELPPLPPLLEPTTKESG